MTAHAQDDGFHEIQLNGKQLVFLFMAATVVSVVIFLCGVLVGRGVRSAQDMERQSAARIAEPTADVLPGPPAAAQSMSDSSAAPNPTPRGGDGEDPGNAAAAVRPIPTDELRPDPPSASKPTERSAAPVPPPSAAAPAPIAKPTPVPTTPGKTAPVALADSAAPRATVRPPPVEDRASASSNGWVVQLAALNDRGEAEEIARRLVNKGYGAFVVTPASGTPVVYRVRVGTFKTKSEADVMGAKLKKEERFDPWITR